MNFRSTSLKLVLLGSAAMFTTSAWASPPGAGDIITRTETVKYLPSEAASDEGAQQLYRRLQAAAARVCSDSGPMPLRHDRMSSYATCVKQALDGAVRQLGVPVVSMLHQYGDSPGSQAVVSR